MKLAVAVRGMKNRSDDNDALLINVMYCRRVGDSLPVISRAYSFAFHCTECFFIYYLAPAVTRLTPYFNTV